MENIDNEILLVLPDNWAFIKLNDTWKHISGRKPFLSNYNAGENGILYITGVSNLVNSKIDARSISCNTIQRFTLYL